MYYFFICKDNPSHIKNRKPRLFRAMRQLRNFRFNILCMCYDLYLIRGACPAYGAATPVYLYSFLEYYYVWVDIL